MRQSTDRRKKKRKPRIVAKQKLTSTYKKAHERTELLHFYTNIQKYMCLKKEDKYPVFVWQILLYHKASAL